MTFDSFIGAIWFSGLTCLVGYILGCVFPLSKLKERFAK